MVALNPVAWSAPESSPQHVYHNPRVQPSKIVEFVATRPNVSSSVFVGFGAFTEKILKDASYAPHLVRLQTRAGAGLTLVGRLSEGTSVDAVKGSVLTAYTTPIGLAKMAPSLLYLPPASASSRLVVQVPTATPAGDFLSLSPSLAALSPIWSILPDNLVVLLSSTPQQIADFATLSYRLTASHVVHLFDHYSTGREFGHSILPLADQRTQQTSVSEVLGEAGYSYFEYAGDHNARTVIVCLNGPLALVAKASVTSGSGIGIVIVNVLRPWSGSTLRSILPLTVSNVHVLEDVSTGLSNGALYSDVFASLWGNDVDVCIRSHRTIKQGIHSFLSEIAPSISKQSLHHDVIKKLLLFSVPQSPFSNISRMVEDLFLGNGGISARLLTDYDALSKQGDTSLLQYAKPGSPVLLVTPWSPKEFDSNLPLDIISLIHERRLKIFSINAKAVASQISDGTIADTIQSILAYLAFVRLYLGSSATENTVFEIARATLGSNVENIGIQQLSQVAWDNLKAIKLSPIEIPSHTSPMKQFQGNAIAVEADSSETSASGTRLGFWLTPLDYDRNVFHLEFDTSGTGLKYAIGEALGVHGWNDEQEVLDFCSWYGIDPNKLMTIPVAADDAKMHTRTVLQALQQQIDLFGRPPKSFYVELAEYANNPVDRHALLFIGSPEGSSTFKKLSEKDTVTFADILKMYPSARPGVERLCELVGDIKPRHYSIASAQSVVGNRVDLLVVTVDWVTPSGTPRCGQCTRYLAGLKIGQKVTVSIKPSVMKLPPNPKQPIIMAGLGTGAAPFRAFLQHLAHLAQKGEEIGPVYYYFGSRHQASEYLYGEEIEAFILDGVITKAGLAFSRDSTKKVYIQHKMLEDSEMLAQMLHDDEGAFYLCGPTWPVPDVYEALVNALVKYKGSDPVQAGNYLESLKEEERYVLEVY
ncbi:assimilatory sulfite reductase [Cyathus striatus]|nr:assimilatory sulfite reductase [Cyathus striatus]